MSQPQSLYVHDVGACTALGFCAASSAAAVWAGISRIEAPDVPIRASTAAHFQASCPIVDADTPLPQRLCALAEAALQPMLAQLEELPGRLNVFVAVPKHAAGVNLGQAVVLSLERSLARFRRGRQQSLCIKALSADAGDFAQSLQVAARYLAAPGAGELCIVGGVDSHISPCRLEALRVQGELYDAQSGEGVIAGEAAAFLTLGSSAKSPQRPVLACIDTWRHHVVREDGPQATPARQTALHKSIAELAAKPWVAELWVNDASGESWRASALAAIYGAPHLGSFAHTEMLEPSRLMGDTGVAFAPLACVIALHGVSAGLVGPAQVLLTAQSPTHATAWLLTARQTRPSAFDCDGYWRTRRKRAL